MGSARRRSVSCQAVAGQLVEPRVGVVIERDQLAAGRRRAAAPARGSAVVRRNLSSGRVRSRIAPASGSLKAADERVVVEVERGPSGFAEQRRAAPTGGCPCAGRRATRRRGCSGAAGRDNDGCAPGGRRCSAAAGRQARHARARSRYRFTSSTWHSSSHTRSQGPRPRWPRFSTNIGAVGSPVAGSVASHTAASKSHQSAQPRRRGAEQLLHALRFARALDQHVAAVPHAFESCAAGGISQPAHLWRSNISVRDQFGGAFGDRDRRAVGVSVRDRRHHGRVGRPAAAVIQRLALEDTGKAKSRRSAQPSQPHLSSAKPS